MAAEVKLGKSLDAIIEENKKKASSGGARSKPRGVRVDGPKKGIRIQGGSGKQTAKESRAPKMLGRGGGGGGGLGVKGAGVQKRTGRAQTYDFDAMDVDDYGAPPPRRQRGGGGGGRGGGFGGRAPIGGGYGRRNEAPVPRGNPDDVWTHDLYDPRQGPARRGRAPIGASSRPQQQKQGYTLTVSNLDFTVSDADIKELFSTCGKLVESFIHYDNSGRSDGVATVTYERLESAEKAIKEYHGVMLDKKELHIEFAEDKPVQKLSSGKVLSRPHDNGGPAVGGTFRRALEALPVRGMGDGGSPRRPRPRAGGLAASGRMGGGGRGGGGRLRSTVGRSKADLDAELDAMQE